MKMNQGPTEEKFQGKAQLVAMIEREGRGSL